MSTTSKFNIGDTVKTCAERADNGKGFKKVGGGYEHIIGLCNTTIVIRSKLFIQECNEWYYNDSSEVTNGYAEHALTLILPGDNSNTEPIYDTF